MTTLDPCCSEAKVAAREALHRLKYGEDHCSPGHCYCNRDARMVEWMYMLLRPVMANASGRSIMISHVALALHQDEFGPWTFCVTDGCDCNTPSFAAVDAMILALGDDATW